MSSFAIRFVTVFFFLLVPPFAMSGEESPFSFAADTTFEVRQFELDLDQCCFWGEYMLEHQFARVVRFSFEDYLQKAGVRMVGEDGEVLLDIRMDYHRQFHGDGTPIPMKRMRPPAFGFVIEAYRGNELAYRHQIANKVLRSAPTQGLGEDIEMSKDYFYAFVFGGEIGKQLVGEIADLSEVKKISLSDYESVINDFKTQFFSEKVKVETTPYIPESVIDDYIARTRSDDINERIRAYIDIRNGWFNSERLFDAIVEQISRDYTTQDKDVIKAVREAMNALGSSGMMKYELVLMAIGMRGDVDSAVHKEVSDSLEILEKRRAFNGRVHDVSRMDPGQSWIVNQLANRLQIQRAGIDDDAIREVNRHYSDNLYLGGVLVDILQSEAYASEHEARSRADFHAWAARTLGDSGNADFLPVLEKLKEKATYKKVRKHANKAFKQLRKLVKKNQKKR